MSSTAAATVAGTVVGGAVAGMLMPKPDNSAGQAAANAANVQSQISQDQWDYYKQNFQPVESKLIEQATAAGSPEEYAAAAGRANADVTGAYDTANKSTANRLQAYGIDPGSPAYQSAMQSVGLSEGAAKAGALTNAYNTTKQQAYSKLLDVTGIGRNIPAQSAASAAGAAQSAGVAQNSLNSQFLQNTQNMQNIGYALQPGVSALTGAAKSYFSTPSADVTPASTSNLMGDQVNLANSGSSSYTPSYLKFAEGGNVTDENDNIVDMRMGGDGKYEAVGLEPRLMKKGYNPAMAKLASKGVITPHMRVPINKMRRGYATGGGVGTTGLAESTAPIPSQSNRVLDGPGTETSDSIPAHVDGKTPAALSKGEFVMSAEVPKLTGEEILQAINRAGLEKRNNQNSSTVSPDAGMTAYADGGSVDWKDQFKNITGYDADALGIKDAESANRAAIQMQQDRSVTPTGFRNPDNQNYGETGTRNEAIYPAKYADGGQVNPRPQDAPIGYGMARISADKIAAKKQYDKENMDAQTEGREMPSFEDWMKSKSNSYFLGGKITQYGLN